MKPDPKIGNEEKGPRPRVLLIAGPTASGKSALALELAARLGGEIVNADSMQVYDGLRVLTARPSRAEEAQQPHHLYGVLDPAETCSAQRWAEMAAAKIAEIEGRGKLPILAGGTGLYFKALVEGLSEMPAIPEEVRAAIRAEVAENLARAHARLAGADPEAAAKIAPTDPQRTARALEVLEATGKPISHWQKQKGAPLFDGASAGFVLDPDRTWLRARIDRRFDQMIGEGALDEVAALFERGLSPDLPAMKALGVPPLLAHIAGELGLEAAIEQAKTQTKQYAKRQSTWFRHQMISWKRLSAQEMESQIQEIFSFIDDFGLTPSG
ncbi:tRNA (adenosine(37)-N6)-dimethylallyltransferase MiaA [Tepidicaulis sp.]|uniref:tRNA (adenosine(37)-N6)-dimethylallyltransferase MiaA n=1 Tax=Tepidicaulis sp. TaxID=1920809 RepID=UPI003B5B4E96